MPKPQNSSTPISASRMRERRSSPAPAAMTDGTSRTDLASEPRPRVGLTSTNSTATAAKWTTSSRMAASTGTASALVPGSGSRATSPPPSSAPPPRAKPMTTPPPDRPVSIFASGSAASAASTYHESSGPLSSAR